MLRNKKTGIKLFSLVLVLLMMASIFAGCNNKALQEELDKAKSQAEEANQSAKDAQVAADKASQLAEELQGQLEDAYAKIEEQKKANEQLQDELNKTKEDLESHKNDPAPEPVDPEDWWEDVKDVVTESVLAEISQLKVKYLTLRQLWYTEANYYKLAQVFDDAYTNLYKATTAEGVNEVMAKLADEIAKVPSIASEGEAVQAVIKSFGDVDTDLFLTHEEIVKKARDDYIAWLMTYSNYFASVGLNVDEYVDEYFDENSDPASAIISKLDGHVMNTFNIATSTLRYAESKLTVLRNYANMVAKEAYNSVKTILDNPTFADIKTQSSAIEAAYELYKIFMVANGGDDSPIKHVEDKKVKLTGEDFVKNYVLVLYDSWFHQYQSQAKAFVDSLPVFFMNNSAATGDLEDLDTAYLGGYLDAEIGSDYAVDYKSLTACKSDDQQIRNEFERIATLYTAEFLKPTYSGSFKGRLSIDEAYAEVDAVVAKAVAEMVQLYYNKIVAPEIEKKVATFKAKADGFTSSTESETVYKNFDKTFGNGLLSKVDTYLNELKQFKVPTYAELDNIGNLKMFNLPEPEKTGGDVLLNLNTDDDTSAFVAVLKALNDTVKAAAEYYAKAEFELNNSINFHDFQKELSKEVAEYASDNIGMKNGTLVTQADNVRKKQGGSSAGLSDSAKDSYRNSIISLANTARDAILALDYDSYTAQTYQAKNTSKKALYYQKSDGKITTESSGNIALTIVVDKLVVAKDAAVDIAKEYADLMFNTLVNLCRTHITNYINAAKAAYASYMTDTDSLNLANDINAYVEKLTSSTTISAIAGFKNEKFSNKNNQINTTTYPNVVALTGAGYYVETVGAGQYLVHIKDYDKSAEEIINTDADSYANLAETEFDNACNLVLYDDDGDDDTLGAYKSLAKVVQLAYHKDDAIVKLNKIRDAVKGVWNSSTGSWATVVAYDWTEGATELVDKTYNEPAYTYERTSSRAARYLQEIDAVYAKALEKIMAVTMLNSNDKYSDATDKVDGILIQLFKGQDEKKASQSLDDYSFKVAYDRYYALTVTGEPAYDWSKYNAQ